MSDPTEPREIGLAFLAAWAAGDMETAQKYLDPEVTFESPQVTLAGVDAVSGAMGEFAQAVQSIDVLAAAAHDDEVLVMYDMTTGPFGVIRAAEHYTIRDGRITADQLVFDTTPMQG